MGRPKTRTSNYFTNKREVKDGKDEDPTQQSEKPLKYPTIFNSADVAIITKPDLIAAVEFDEPAARRNLQCVRPGMEVLLSSKPGEGMTEFLEFLERRRIHAGEGS